MVGKDREVELKFTLEAVRPDELLAWLGQGRRPTKVALSATYYDTPGLDLRQAGLSLRVREEDGVYIQTVKSTVASRGRLGRGEWSTTVAGPGVDLAAARLTPAKRLLKGAEAPTAQFTVMVDRLSLDLRSPDSLIEASLDRGVVAAGTRSAPVVELELELKSGAPLALFALARRLQLAFPVPLSAVAKSDRGFALAGGTDLAHRRFRQPELSTEMTAGEAFRVAARAAVEQMIWNAALVRQAASPEAIHQTRIGVRRLRATLSTFRSVVADDERHGVRERLKALGKELDEARNLDVFLDGVWRRAPASDRPAADESALIAAKAAAYDRARLAVNSADARTLALDTLAWIELGAWTHRRADGAMARDKPVARFAARSLGKGRRKLVEAGKSLAGLTPEDRHHVRIRAKVLRYAAEVLAPVFPGKPKRAERYLDALEDLAETLGELNDLATARAVVSHLPAEIALGGDEAVREARLIDQAQAAFERFRRAKPFWPE